MNLVSIRLLLSSARKIPVTIILIPLLWLFLGVAAAINLSIYEDFGLLLAGIVGFAMLIIKNRPLSANKIMVKYHPWV